MEKQIVCIFKMEKINPNSSCTEGRHLLCFEGFERYLTETFQRASVCRYKSDQEFQIEILEHALSS